MSRVRYDFRHDDGSLVLKWQDRTGKRLWHNVGREEIRMHRLGWRWLIAQILKKLCATLRHNA